MIVRKAKEERKHGWAENVRTHRQLRRIATHINPITWGGRLASRPDYFQ
jgi:hypothetical protein